MKLTNTPERFGTVAIALHWVMALAIFGLFGVGWYMVDLTYYDELYKTLPFYHKSVGITLAAVLLFRIVWKLMNPTPKPLAGSSSFEKFAAKAAHLLIYVLLLAIVFSGYLISTADGLPISVFDWFFVPASITGIPEQEDIAGFVHEYLAYALMALVAVHAAAALKHHFFDNDDTLKRMLGTAPRSD
ncbi:MAG: cytochrome b [Pseudomonadota bacterium]